MAKRLIIVGGPSTGKTSLAQELSVKHGITNVRQTDQLTALGWSEASAEAAKWIDEPGDWIVEGVVAPRALRKWLAANPGKPLPEGTSIYVLTRPYVPQSKGQQTMTKGIYTVLTEIYGDLVARGAVFEQHKPDTA